jgi:hypothetical protein
MTSAVSAVSPPIAVSVPAVPWRVGYLAAEVLWFLGFAFAIPLAILVVCAPVALAVKLVFALFGWH